LKTKNKVALTGDRSADRAAPTHQSTQHRAADEFQLVANSEQANACTIKTVNANRNGQFTGRAVGKRPIAPAAAKAALQIDVAALMAVIGKGDDCSVYLDGTEPAFGPDHWCVSRNECERTFVHIPTAKEVLAFVQSNREFLEADDTFLGLWFSGDRKRYCLDVSFSVRGRDAAIRRGIEEQQEAIFCPCSNEQVNLAELSAERDATTAAAVS